jgi:hypothetical protein
LRIGAEEREIIADSDALVDDLVPPPPDRPSVCATCRTWMNPDSPRADTDAPSECENCAEVRQALASAPIALSVISMVSKPSALRDWLTRYKGRPDDPDDTLDPACVDRVRALLGRFLIDHGEALEARLGKIDCLVVVPSTEPRLSHPLEAVVASLDPDVPVQRLLARGTGPLGFRAPHPDGYAVLVPPNEEGQRVLLIDDVYTTGARINSAAVALRAAGYQVAGALVIARRINPTYDVAAAALLDELSARRYDWLQSPYLAPPAT